MLPGPKHISHTALPKLYAECREKVEKDTYFTTTADPWSIVLIIVIEWKYCDNFLPISPIPRSHFNYVVFYCCSFVAGDLLTPTSYM